MTITHTQVTDIGGIENSIASMGTAAAPGASTSVVSITVVAGAVYRISGYIVCTGTAETVLNNAQLRNAGTQITPVPTLTGILCPVAVPSYTAVGTTFNIATVGAATAGSIYTAHITATRVR